MLAFIYREGATIDKTPPTLPSGCSTTVRVDAAPGSASADYHVQWPTATDNDGHTPTLVATHPSGVHSFQLGWTGVYGFYYDASGNMRQCSRSIIVRKYYLQLVSIFVTMTVTEFKGIVHYLIRKLVI